MKIYIAGQGLVDATPEEEAELISAGQAADAEATERKNIEIQRKGILKDNQVKNFLDKTPQEVEQYVENNVNSLAEAKVVLALLAKVVSALAQREMRGYETSGE
jgi:hypothetical protein